MIWHRPFLFPLSLLWAMALSITAWADPYTLVPGDVIRVFHDAMDSPDSVQVDLDGTVGLRELGLIPVAGLSLSDAQNELAGALVQAGLYIDPKVRIAVERYAPIVVAGDVARPGRFEYSPGLTLAAALGLSGGSMAASAQLELERAQIDLTAQSDAAGLALVAATLRQARLRASLDDAELPDLHDVLADLPRIAPSQITALWDSEKRAFLEDQSSAKTLHNAWMNEAAALSAQQRLLDQRIAVQADIVASTARDLDAAKTLEQRGLQTTTRLSLAEQRDADARARVLELESANMAAARALAQVKRDTTRFQRERRDRLLAALMQAQVAEQTQRRALSRASDALTTLSRYAAPGGVTTAQRYTLQSPRKGRNGLRPTSLATPLLPGDILIVQSVQSPIDPGG